MSLFQNLAARSPLHKAGLVIRAKYEYFRVMSYPGTDYCTCYCASPYKTGTTFITYLFSPTHRCLHEPLHFCTLQHLNDAAFLRRRRNFLRADLEASGFFAGNLRNIRKFAPNAAILYLYRDPQSWMESVIQYFTSLQEKVNYNYVLEEFFGSICQVPLYCFSNCCEFQQHSIVESLFDFWESAYLEALEDEKVLVFPLDLVAEKIEVIEDFFQMRARTDPARARKRARREKKLSLAQHFCDPLLRSRWTRVEKRAFTWDWP